MTAIPYFDAHCDTVSLCAADGRSLRQNGGHLDLSRLRGFSRAAQVFALFADGAKFPDGTLFAECARQHDVFVSELSENLDIAAFCRTGDEIRAAVAVGRTAALLSVEGAELLGCDPAKLETAHAWGVRCINLTWNHANRISGSHKDEPERGLSDLGRAFVREAERLHILLDVSHLSDAGFRELADMAARPVVATHSNARAVCPHSRNLTDDMFRAVCQSGGAVGINLYPDFIGGGAMDDVVRHIDRFMELGGAKHICLGGDWDGCDRLGGGMTGVEDIPRLWDALAARGYDEKTLEDIFWNNLLRVFSE